jgi:uncharacterized flavoprotein (TIGR03862 family)
MAPVSQNQINSLSVQSEVTQCILQLSLAIPFFDFQRYTLKDDRKTCNKIENSMNSSKSVAIIGTGPAALMASDILSQAGIAVSIFEKKRGPGRKLLIAGSSGLNISNSLAVAEFVKNYSGPADYWGQLLRDFSPQDWLRFIHGLGLETFEGTSGRYFVKEMKASRLLRAWINRLQERGATFFYEHEWEDFSFHSDIGKIQVTFSGNRTFAFDAVCLCMGGGSYEPKEIPLRWPQILIRKGLKFKPFQPSNTGYQVAWSKKFLEEAEGLPLKNVQLSSARGSRLGEVVITDYGMEGTPVYFVGTPGQAYLDLKPDLSLEMILKKCRATRENLSPIRRVKKQLNLGPGAFALLFHHSSKTDLEKMESLASRIKNFPVEFRAAQPLAESISSSGGLSLGELDLKTMMISQYPGVFAAGEMLDWDAPTGGFLIQGCVSQGFRAGKAILDFCQSK